MRTARSFEKNVVIITYFLKCDEMCMYTVRRELRCCVHVVVCFDYYPIFCSSGASEKAEAREGSLHVLLCSCAATFAASTELHWWLECEAFRDA